MLSACLQLDALLVIGVGQATSRIRCWSIAHSAGAPGPVAECPRQCCGSTGTEQSLDAAAQGSQRRDHRQYASKKLRLNEYLDGFVTKQEMAACHGLVGQPYTTWME